MVAMTLLRATPFVAFFLVGSRLPALAANCKSSGGLTYLGNTRDQSRSVWLSLTDQGSFDLEAAQGNQTVDTWGVPPDAGCISRSRLFVSSGNGGIHRLFETSDNKPCLIDTQNQKRDWNIPPNIQLPNLNLPGRPDIGNLFPDFGRPTLPGPRPPGGLMPTLPGGVQPPIATLPPAGIMPTPSAVAADGRHAYAAWWSTAAIATLPPTGITPGLPTRPPAGVMPTLPGGVQPPIRDAAADGRHAHASWWGQPPICDAAARWRSAAGGGLPGGVVRLPDGTLVRSVAGTQERCIDPRTPTPGGQARWPICPEETLAEAARSGAMPGEVPLTEGRDLLEPTLWNAWVQPVYVQVSDERYGLDMDTHLGSVTVGLDRRLGENVVLGASLAFQNSSTRGSMICCRLRAAGSLSVPISPSVCRLNGRSTCR